MSANSSWNGWARVSRRPWKRVVRDAPSAEVALWQLEAWAGRQRRPPTDSCVLPEGQRPETPFSYRER